MSSPSCIFVDRGRRSRSALSTFLGRDELLFVKVDNVSSTMTCKGGQDPDAPDSPHRPSVQYGQSRRSRLQTS